MSKGAVAMMTKAMALDYARENIRVTAGRPGDTFVSAGSKRATSKARAPVTREETMRAASTYIPMGPLQPERSHRPCCPVQMILLFITGHLLLADGGQ